MDKPSKRCSTCHIEKLIVDFTPYAKGPMGVVARCKTCCARIARERYHNDPERRAKVIQASCRWQRQNPARARSYAIKSYHKLKAMKVPT